MPGSIFPLPVMLDEEDQKVYDELKPPTSMVVRYGYQRMVAELPYDGQAKPGCGSKLVAVTPRGTEVVEMLTTTCGNAGCGKSVSRDQMLKYIENSGGKQYPFTTRGKILRVATVEDLNEHARLESRRPDIIRLCKALINELHLQMKLVEVETMLGDEQVMFYYLAEDRVDFRELVRRLAAELQTRIEMVQVNDREEARLVADFEKCGQHCCCRQFLKVLKPVSMRSAKVQKNTLDPQKISGRCGRLMCCLRYEDQTYSDLKKQLPHRKTLVESEDGIGVVLDSQILTQLVLIRIGNQPPAAYPLEHLRPLTKEETKQWAQEHGDPTKPREQPDGPPRRGGGHSGGNRGGRPDGGGQGGGKRPPRRPEPGKPLNDDEVESKEGTNSAQVNDQAAPDAAPPTQRGSDDQPGSSDQPKPKRKRRRRRRKGGGGGSEPGA